MIRFKWVKISNFMSFGQKEVFVDLDTKNTRAIMGRNEDIGETGSSANGVGKTTIFNAIIFALYGKGIDKLKTDEYINIVNGKKLTVELCFEKGEKTYVIRRGRKPNFLDITEDGTSLTLDAMRNTDEAITALLGYGYDLFMSSFFLSPHRQSFMAMSGPEQRSMIENMLSLDVLAERAVALKTIRDEISVDKKVLDRDIVRYEQSNQNILDTHQRLLRSSEKFEEDRSKSLKELQIQLKSLKEIDLTELREIFDEYVDKRNSLRNLSDKSKDLYNLKRELEKKYSDAVKAVSEHKEISEKIKQYDANKLSMTKEARDFIECHDDISIYEDKLNTAKESFDLYKQLSADKKSLLSEISYIERDIRVLSEKLARLEQEITGHENGKCHVCGGDYVDSVHLEKIKKEAFELKDEISEQNRIKSDAEEKLSLTNKSLESVYVMPEEEMRELEEVILTLRESIRAVENSNSVENPLLGMLKAIKVLSDDEFRELDNEVKKAEKDFNKITDDLSLIQDVIDGYEEVLSELRVSKREHIDAMEAEIASIEASIEKHRMSKNDFLDQAEKVMEGYVDLDVLQKDSKALEEKEKHVGYLIKLLTDSKSFIRRRILDNYVPYLNKKINEYSEKLGLPHVCEVDSDLSVSLTYMSRGVSYYNLSRGERLRLDMATTGAFRDVMALLGKGCNLSLLDEVLDSALDASGIHSAMNFIGSNAETVLLVTHREELSSGIGDKIVVVKRNGFSDIE